MRRHDVHFARLARPRHDPAVPDAWPASGGFDANATVNHSFPAGGPGATLGPSGVWGGEGHYGLQLLGAAQVEGCNASFACCDALNAACGREGLGAVLCGVHAEGPCIATLGGLPLRARVPSAGGRARDLVCRQWRRVGTRGRSSPADEST